MKKHLLIPAILVTLGLLSSCSAYRMDIQQGNVIEQAAVDSIRQGMSTSEVAAVLGSPLMQDDFKQNRWDYVFYLKKPGQKTERKSLAVVFNNAGRVTQVLK
jgi:outer membrane protein assembly factor BamE